MPLIPTIGFFVLAVAALVGVVGYLIDQSAELHERSD